MAKAELTRNHFIKSALKNRYPQLAVFIVMLAGYLFAILAGIIGTPVGSHNFSIIFVWIAWWAILILVAVPFFGRGWCAVCPIPLPGEWIQRGRVLGPQETHHGEHGEESKGSSVRSAVSHDLLSKSRAAGVRGTNGVCSVVKRESR